MLNLWAASLLSRQENPPLKSVCTLLFCQFQVRAWWRAWWFSARRSSSFKHIFNKVPCSEAARSGNKSLVPGQRFELPGQLCFWSWVQLGRSAIKLTRGQVPVLAIWVDSIMCSPLYTRTSECLILVLVVLFPDIRITGLVMERSGHWFQVQLHGEDWDILYPRKQQDIENQKAKLCPWAQKATFRSHFCCVLNWYRCELWNLLK